MDYSTPTRYILIEIECYAGWRKLIVRLDKWPRRSDAGEGAVSLNWTSHKTTSQVNTTRFETFDIFNKRPRPTELNIFFNFL